MPKRPLDLPQFALLALIAANILATLFSGRVAYSLFGHWHLWGFMLMALMIYRYGPSVRECRAVTMLILGTAVVVALYGLTVYFGYDPLRWLYPFVFSSQEGRNYVHSFFGNPEYFGGYMAPVAALAFSRFFSVGAGRGARVGWLLATLFFLIGLVLSGTRGAALGLALAMSLLLMRELPGLSGRTRRWVIGGLGALVVAVALAVLVFSFPNPLNRRNMRLAQRFVELFDVTSASVRERILFFTISGRMIADKPVTGLGPGCFRLGFFPTVGKLVEDEPRAGMMMMAADLQNRVAEHAHNDYLEIWTQTGTLGLAAFLFLISAAVVQYSRTPRAASAGGDEAELELCRTGFFAAGACLFFNAAFSFPFHLPERASLVWVLVGFFFSANRLLRSRRASMAKDTPDEEPAGPPHETFALPAE